MTVLVTPKDVQQSIPAIRINKHENVADVFLPYLQVADVNGVPMSTSFVRHFNVNLSTGEVVSTKDLPVSSGLLATCTVVYDEVSDMIIINDGNIKLLRGADNFTEVVPGEECHFHKYLQLCNQVYGEYSVNLYIENKDDTKRLMFVDGNEPVEIKDQAGIFKASVADEYVIASGMAFTFLGEVYNKSSDRLLLLWSNEMKSIIVVDNGKARRLNVKYDRAMHVEGGVLFTKRTKNGKHRLVSVTYEQLQEAVNGNEKKFSALIKRSEQINGDIIGITCAGSDNQTRFMLAEERGLTLLEWKIDPLGKNGMDVKEELPSDTESMPSMYIEGKDSELFPISYVVEE